MEDKGIQTSMEVDDNDDIVLGKEVPTSLDPSSVSFMQHHSSLEDSNWDSFLEGKRRTAGNDGFIGVLKPGECYSFPLTYSFDPTPSWKVDLEESNVQLQEDQKKEEPRTITPKYVLTEFLSYMKASSVAILEDVLRCDLEAQGEATMELEEKSSAVNLKEEPEDQPILPSLSGNNDDVHNVTDLDPQLILKRQRLKEILITTPSQGFREVLYTCEVDEINRKSTSMRPKRRFPRYEEWRHQVIPSIPPPPEIKEDTNNSTSISSEKTLRLHLPYENAFLFKVDGFQDDLHSILNVISGGPLSCMVIDAYLTSRINLHNERALSQLHRLRPGVNSRLEYLPCRFLPVFHKNQDVSTFLPNLNFLPKSPLLNSILIAPQFSCQHFYLAVFYFRKKKINLFDSCWRKIPLALRNRQISNVLEQLNVKLTEEIVVEEENITNKSWSHRKIEAWNNWKEMEWKIERVPESPQQIDKYSCGIYVIHHAEEEMRGKYYKKKGRLRGADVGNIRMQITTVLLKTTGNGKRVLDALLE
ncbi:unnamed protein product [Orchesella dallaii]|uniref:Ubiquitin-like protease family profile domain-containing protein n=1 Tax=Orchesella dallaii TaxID=48710 RepID=A0ABP1R219_9HEXA